MKHYELSFKTYKSTEETINFFIRPKNSIISDLITSEFVTIKFDTLEKAKECVRDLKFYLPNYKKSLLHKFKSDITLDEKIHFMNLATKQVNNIIQKYSRLFECPIDMVILGFEKSHSIYEVIRTINRFDVDTITDFN